MQPALLRIATAGSVDDGKSTLIGRLLYDSKHVLEDQLAAVERSSRARGDAYVNLALLTDGLRAEREQGITIDVAYRYFATARRKFIVADTPGHQRYTRNMVTGASTADLAIILIDARQGVVEQSRRHAFIASLLGISHLVVCVNKMDLVGFDQAAFRPIEAELTEFAAKLSVEDLTFIPMSALLGDNVVERSARMRWYAGSPLLDHLENVQIASDRNLIDCRFPVQWVVRPIDQAHHDYRGYAGQVASGVLRKGDDVVVLPAMARSRVARIDTFDGEVREAFPPMSVTVVLEDDLDVSRGDMICRPPDVPTVGQDLEAIVCWMGEAPLVVGKTYALKQTTKDVRARVESVRYRVDVNDLSRDEGARSLTLNETGHVQLRVSSPLFYDAYKVNRETGSFILIDEATNYTVAGGMLIEAQVERPRAAPHAAPPPETELPTSPRAPNDDAALTRAARDAALRRRGATVWLTGPSGVGKSRIGEALEQRIVLLGRSAYLLDEDDLRRGLCGDLGFSREDRDENTRRVAHAAQLLADSGCVAIAALFSPLAEERARARAITEASGLEFLEVHVSASIDEGERRAPGGVHAQAAAAEVVGLGGVGEPYEVPAAPDVKVPGAREIDRAVDAVIEALRERGILS